MPRDDPARGIYNYEHAKAVGIRVSPIPPADEICPPPGEKAPPRTCRVDPRFTLIHVGYSVEAVQEARSAYGKGRVICSSPGAGAFLFRTPADQEVDLEKLMQARLARANGVDATDDVDELVRGCASTEFGRGFLSFDGWTVKISVEPSVVGPIVLSVGPVRRAPGPGAPPWIEHDLVLENRSDRPVQFADTGSFLRGPSGRPVLLAAEERCGYGTDTRKSPFEASACLAYIDAFRIKPHGSVSRRITLFRGLRGMKPLAAGTYVFRKPLRFQLGNELPAEGAGRSVAIRLVYQIESAAG